MLLWTCDSEVFGFIDVVYVLHIFTLYIHCTTVDTDLHIMIIFSTETFEILFFFVTKIMLLCSCFKTR